MKKYLKIIFTAIAIIMCISIFVGCNSGSGSTHSTGAVHQTVSKEKGLKLKVEKIETSSYGGDFTTVYCSIENVSESYGNATVYRNVKVKAVFKDSKGKILDTKWTYAIGSTYLDCGEKKTFKYMVESNYVKTVELSFVYD